jgi:hypothetical protein
MESSNDKIIKLSIPKPVQKRKRGRPSLYLTHNRNDTSVRMDVMNKTSLRALRREYEVFFEIFCQLKGYQMPLSLTAFQQALSEFAQYILSWENPIAIQTRFGNLQNMILYLGLLIDL